MAHTSTRRRMLLWRECWLSSCIPWFRECLHYLTIFMERAHHTVKPESSRQDAKPQRAKRAAKTPRRHEGRNAHAKPESPQAHAKTLSRKERKEPPRRHSSWAANLRSNVVRLWTTDRELGDTQSASSADQFHLLLERTTMPRFAPLREPLA